MDCVILCETYEHGVSVLWRASAALLRWQRLAIRNLALCAQRAAAACALRAREEHGASDGERREVRRFQRLHAYRREGLAVARRVMLHMISVWRARRVILP